MAQENSVQKKMENIFRGTCGSFEHCTEATIQNFLQQCREEGIDPQFCMSWVEEHKAEIPDWQEVSRISLDWVNQHTSTGSPISFSE